MGHCPCFGFLSNRKEFTPEIINKESLKESKVSRPEPGSKVDSNSRKEPSTRRNRDTNISNSSNMAPTFTYKELAIATNNFSPVCLLGRGGFGAVYKGKLGSTGQVVAVKQLDLTEGMQGEKEFLVEVLMLNLLHHPNLVNLLGFCAEGIQRLLVYEFMPMGSLEDHLFDIPFEKEPLDWKTRIEIATGAAKGLDYLHNASPPVIYRDLKASNILLDEGFDPKLSDFGLAKFGPTGDNSHVSTRVMGTYGYCAPEYASTGRLTPKTDIYTFGVLLLELITGYRAVDEINGRRMHLIHWALPLMIDRNNYLKLADPSLEGKFSTSVFNKAVEVASMCLNENANSRPSSSELVSAMEYLLSRINEPKVGQKVSLGRPEIDFSPNVKEVIVEKDLDRDRAVAEAKMWGESWREKRRPSPQAISDESSR